MTELETLQRAKMYMEKLANGIDPITEADVPEDDIINNVRLSRCFFYVCGVLDQAIDRERKKSSKNLPAFQMSVQELGQLKPLDRPAQISELVNEINARIDQNRMKKLAATSITNWLVELGMLEVPEGREQQTTHGQGRKSRHFHRGADRLQGRIYRDPIYPRSSAIYPG